ncbi:DUF4080 domain-containing protein, partial [Marinagarivorans algicola]
YWDMIGNSGRFKYTLPHVLSDKPFDEFMAITQWIYDKTGQSHNISLKKLYEFFSQAIEALFPEKHALVISKLKEDYSASKLKSVFEGLNLYAVQHVEPVSKNKSLQRQQRHMS